MDKNIENMIAMRSAWDKYRDGKTMPLEDAHVFAAGFISALYLVTGEQEFGDWLNNPPNVGSELPAVREFRFEAYRRWRDANGYHSRPSERATKPSKTEEQHLADLAVDDALRDARLAGDLSSDYLAKQRADGSVTMTNQQLEHFRARTIAEAVDKFANGSLRRALTDEITKTLQHHNRLDGAIRADLVETVLSAITKAS